jgi:hypothetical protein
MKEVTTDSAEKIISQQAALNRRRGANFIDNLSTMINNHSGPDYTKSHKEYMEERVTGIVRNPPNSRKK